MQRKLASIQIINNKHGIAGADAIERVDVLGWSCVAKKGEFNIGDKIVFIEIDSLLPHDTWSAFLWKKGDAGKQIIRLKTVKLRGQISQGLVLPLSVLDGKKFADDTRDNPVYEWTEGKDVTELLGITKYEPVIPAQLAGQVKGQFPCFIPKTDETRVQAEPGIIEEFEGKQVYITTKMDGSSGTMFLSQGVFGVCSRNLEFKEDSDNTIWKLARKYDVQNKLAKFPNHAIQGEVCGPGIQKNRLNLKEHDFFVFNVYDIRAGKYVNYSDLIDIVNQLEMKMVPINYEGVFDPTWDLPKLLEMAKGKYSGTENQREGIVIRPIEECQSESLKGRMSFKVINNLFLMDGGE